MIFNLNKSLFGLLEIISVLIEDPPILLKMGIVKMVLKNFYAMVVINLFSMNTNSVGYDSHLNIEKWVQFIE